MLQINAAVSQAINQSGIKVRPNADPGLWLMFLLPAAMMISCVKHIQETSQLFRLCTGLSVGLMGTSVIFILQGARKKPLTIIRTLHLIPAALTATLFRFCFHTGLIFSLISGLISSVCYWRMMMTIFHKFPLSFTIGELSIAVQALILLLYGTVINAYIAIIRTPIKVLDISTIIIQVGLCSIGLICVLTHHFKGLRKTVPFYAMAVSILFFFLIILLHIILQQNVLLWMVAFLFEDINRTKMVVYWVACTVAAVIAVNRQIRGAQKATPAVRKVFHIFAVAVFIPGLLYECSFIYLASGVVLGIFAALEMLRVLNLPPLGGSLQNGFVLYRDDKDTGAVALTPMYLLVGCSLPLWIHPAPCDIVDSVGFNLVPVISGVLATGVGDTAASIIGTSIGKHKWPGTNKTMEGTMGCIISQLAVIYMLMYLGYINNTNQYESLKIVIAIVIGSLVEATTTQIDNIVLPLVLYIILC